MQSAAEKMAEKFKSISIKTPQIPVIQNADVTSFQSADAIRDALIHQLTLPVRWVETIQAFKARGITHVVECGPGKALSGMVKRIDAELVSANVADPASLHATRELLA
jgi:[acyl-carrier-protein] S-malonyltransferase